MAGDNQSMESVTTATTYPHDVEQQPSHEDSNSVYPNESVFSETAARFRINLCKNYMITGSCPYAQHCMFAHGKEELRTVEDNLRDGLVTEEAIKVYIKKKIISIQRRNKKKKQKARKMGLLNKHAAASEAGFDETGPTASRLVYSYNPYNLFVLNDEDYLYTLPPKLQRAAVAPVYEDVDEEDGLCDRQSASEMLCTAAPRVEDSNGKPYCLYNASDSSPEHSIMSSSSSVCGTVCDDLMHTNAGDEEANNFYAYCDNTSVVMMPHCITTQ